MWYIIESIGWNFDIGFWCAAERQCGMLGTTIVRAELAAAYKTFWVIDALLKHFARKKENSATDAVLKENVVEVAPCSRSGF